MTDRIQNDKAIADCRIQSAEYSHGGQIYPTLISLDHGFSHSTQRAGKTLGREKATS
jgi:hypothetical protein